MTGDLFIVLKAFFVVASHFLDELLRKKCSKISDHFWIQSFFPLPLQMLCQEHSLSYYLVLPIAGEKKRCIYAISQDQ